MSRMTNFTDPMAVPASAPAAQRPRGLRGLWHRLTLHRQARLDHERARGSVHLQMLRQAQARLEADWLANQTELKQLEQDRAVVQAQCDEDLISALSRHLVMTRLDEVRGIGSKTKADIIRDVFDGHLEDLRSAGWITGISEARQRAINEWILTYRRQFPQLLQEEFPSKRQILNHYRPRLEDLDGPIGQLRARRDELVALREAVSDALSQLWRVTVQDFVAALRDPSNAAAVNAVQGYLNGAYAEWEPMPEWFRRACQRQETR